MSETIQVDVLLVGSGIMSATLGTLLAKLDPSLRILMVERLEQVAQESSDGWNNAGTGHAGYCELNYTPQSADGQVNIQRALTINANFETSLQLWSSLVEQQDLPAPSTFINPTPHQSFVWGEADVDFLRQRQALLSQHPLFEDMQYSADTAQLQDWMPLIMKQRDGKQAVAATRVEYGTDVNFGALTRLLVQGLQQRPSFELRLHHAVRTLRRSKNNRWEAVIADRASDKEQVVQAGFVFLGAGGGTLPLLQHANIPEGQGYGGFPVSGQWLICHDPEVIAQHHSKVYGKAPLGAPPMSVPHLDTRLIDGKPALLFGPYAGFTTKFLKQGSWFDLPASITRGNLKSMMGAGWHNLDLTRYLIGEVLQSHHQRMESLRNFMPTAKDEDWTLAHAGQRVQIIKPCEKQGGKLEFGTEIVSAADGSLAALLGASPGASTSAAAMLSVIERCFTPQLQHSGWGEQLKQLIPAYGASLIEDHALLRKVRASTLATLHLGTPVSKQAAT
jgi:malate dehydrogenase (quinone)